MHDQEGVVVVEAGAHEATQQLLLRPRPRTRPELGGEHQSARAQASGGVRIVTVVVVRSKNVVVDATLFSWLY